MVSLLSTRVLAERVGPSAERQYLCRRRESEGHLSGGRVGVTARVSQRGDRATKEKPRCHHLYHGEASRPLQHGNTQASASLSTQDSQSVRQCAADRTRARATFPIRPCEDCGADGTCSSYYFVFLIWRLLLFKLSDAESSDVFLLCYKSTFSSVCTFFFRTLLLHNVPRHNIVLFPGLRFI